MKIKTFYVHCCTFLLLLAVQQVHAQFTPTNDFASRINQVFEHIDKNRIPHDLLLDYAMEFAELSAYGNTLHDNNIVHRGTLTAIYNTLLMARTSTGVPDLVAPDVFKANWDAEREMDKIAISGLYYKYSKIRSNAYPNSLTVAHNKYYDKFVNGVWQNPYHIQQVFAMAPPILVFKNLSVDVEVPSNIWYSNQGASVQTLQIDFGDGRGYQTMNFDQVRRIHYRTAGLYEWKYKLTLTNRQVLHSHSKIHIRGTKSARNKSDKSLLTEKRLPNEPCVAGPAIDMVEFQGTQTYQGTANSATLEIDYALNDCIIRNPLIVAEGFDSGLLGEENGLGDVELDDFRRSYNFAGGLPGELENYDIIYINWDQGQDDLRRNALLLEDIIAWVNGENTTTNQNVVLGQSMGGLLARYALADMEDRNLDHNTRLYISHDAPHQGANIPLSILYFARHLVDEFVTTPLGDMNLDPNEGGSVTLEDIQNLIDKPATRQLLKRSINSNFQLDTSDHDAWSQDLETIGYPQQTRNIAISNGSHCGNAQTIAPSEVLFSIDGEGQTSTLTDILLEITPFYPVGAFADLSLIGIAAVFNEPGLLIGTLPGNSSFDIDFEAKTMPISGASQRIYKGKITFTKKLLWVLDITVNLTDREYNSPTTELALDYFPGGIYDSPINIGDEEIDNAFLNIGINVFANDKGFGFIPTPSSLDVGSNAVTLSEEEYFRNYNSASPPTGNRAIPFQNFITAYANANSINEQHISFNARNGNWLATELDTTVANEIFDCSIACADDLLEGSDYLCGQETFFIDANPNVITNTNWTISGNNNAVTIVSFTNQEIVLQAVSGYRTEVTLEATVQSNACGSTATFSKTIWVGQPGLPTGLSGPTQVLTGALVDYVAGTSAGATSYKWRVPHPGLTVSQFTYTGPRWQQRSYDTHRYPTFFTGEGEIAGWVQVAGENPCGEGGSRKLWVVHSPTGEGGIPLWGGGDDEDTVSLSPNPANDRVQIDLSNEDITKSAFIEKVYIVDNSSVILGEQSFDGSKRTESLEISNLKSGVYVLAVQTNKGIITKKLLVQ